MKSLLLILLMSIVTFAQSNQIDKSFESATQIDISLNSGNLLIQKSNSKKISIMVKFSYDKEDYNPEIEKRGNRIVIRERMKRNWSWGNSSRGEANWTIQIPDGMEIEFGTGSGDLNVDGVSFSEFQSSTGSGDLTFNNTAGMIEASTGSGDVKIENHKGDIEASRGSGDFDGKKINGKLKVSGGSGDFKVKGFIGEAKIGAGSGSIELYDAELTKRSKLGTGSGDIAVTLSKGLKDDLELSAGSGDLDLDFQGNEINAYFELVARYENKIRTPFKYKTEKKMERYGDDSYLKTAEVGKASVNVYMTSGSGVVKVVE